MAAYLLACTREEQRPAIRFLGAEGEIPADIHCRMLKQYGDACELLQQVYEWRKKFQSRASRLTDAPCSCRTHTSTTPDATSAVERLPRGNRRVTIGEVAEELNISHVLTHHIIHDILQYHKVSAKGVPKQLTPDLEDRRVDACETLMRGYEDKGYELLRLIFTGDK